MANLFSELHDFKTNIVIEEEAFTTAANEFDELSGKIDSLMKDINEMLNDAFDIPAPSLSKPTVSIDEAKFGEKIVCPEFPEASAEIEYPEMPEKPDFSSYIEDILASVGAEL